jgi:hypothetical protein
VLKSRRVVPGRLLASGFRFELSTWAGAAADLCGRWRLAVGRGGGVGPQSATEKHRSLAHRKAL